MPQIDQKIVVRMQTVLRETGSVSDALGTLRGLLPDQDRNTVRIIEYAREAFGLSLREAAPIAGWDADGAGEIPDDRLDELVIPAVRRHRSHWDAPDRVSAGD